MKSIDRASHLTDENPLTWAIRSDRCAYSIYVPSGTKLSMLGTTSGYTRKPHMNSAVHALAFFESDHLK